MLSYVEVNSLSDPVINFLYLSKPIQFNSNHMLDIVVYIKQK